MNKSIDTKVRANDKKTLLIGLDGASWKIIYPLIEEGKLPNLKKLMDEGAHGTLMSTETMISPSVWTSILTGKKPQHHGIVDFMTLQNNLKAKRLWSMFEDYGKIAGVAGFMMTWPPKLKNKGFLIPDHFAPGTETIPEDVKFLREITNTQEVYKNLSFKKMWQILNRSIKYGIGMSTLFKAGLMFLYKKAANPEYLDMYYKEVNMFMLFMEKIFTTLSIMYKPDISAVYFPGTDVLAHKYWSFFKPNDFEDVDAAHIKKYGNVIPDIYIESDKAVGRIVRNFRKMFTNLDVFIVSDHGFKSCEDTTYIPTVRISRLIEKIGMSQKVSYTNIGHNSIIHAVDENHEAQMKTLNEMKSKVDKIIAMDSKIQIFDTSLIEDFLQIAPEQLWKGYRFDEQVQVNGELLRVDDFLDKRTPITGTHEREGIAIASGQSIKKRYKFETADVYDITPTILAFNDMPVAEDMDGSVLKEIVVDSFWEKHPINHIESYGGPEGTNFTEQELETIKDSEEQLRLRLKSLGYMD